MSACRDVKRLKGFDGASVYSRIKIHDIINMIIFSLRSDGEKTKKQKESRNQRNSLDDVRIPALRKHNRCREL